jgi:hypothetical protein
LIARGLRACGRVCKGLGMNTYEGVAQVLIVKRLRSGDFVSADSAGVSGIARLSHGEV